MEMESPDRERDLLPFDVIAAAVSGDEEAISTVVRHYERYITRFATRERVDADGRRRRYVDRNLKHRIIERLIIGILQFRLDKGN